MRTLAHVVEDAERTADDLTPAQGQRLLAEALHVLAAVADPDRVPYGQHTAALVTRLLTVVDGARLTSEAGRPSERRAQAEAQVQALLDRFAAHRLPLDYPAVVVEADRLVLQALILEGHVSEDEAVVRICEMQAQLLDPLFQQACTRRDEAALHARPTTRSKLVVVRR